MKKAFSSVTDRAIDVAGSVADRAVDVAGTIGNRAAVVVDRVGARRGLIGLAVLGAIGGAVLAIKLVRGRAMKSDAIAIEHAPAKTDTKAGKRKNHHGRRNHHAGAMTR